MSIYISGVELPNEETGVFPVIIFADGSVENLFSHEKIGKAMPVPEHGRLIDADALLNSVTTEYGWFEVDNEDVKNAPTVIPEDKIENTLDLVHKDGTT